LTIRSFGLREAHSWTALSSPFSGKIARGREFVVSNESPEELTASSMEEGLLIPLPEAEMDLARFFLKQGTGHFDHPPTAREHFPAGQVEEIIARQMLDKV
jgi:hypothetical protein